MKKTKEIIFKTLEKIAIKSCDSYSWCGMYEPKKPKSLKSIKNNISK